MNEKIRNQDALMVDYDTGNDPDAINDEIGSR